MTDPDTILRELTGAPAHEPARLTPGAHPACDYLARVGFASLLDGTGGPTAPEIGEEDDPGRPIPEAVELARLADHAKVIALLTSRRAEEAGNERHGVRWVRRITWPDRVPGLKAWAGQMTLAKVVNKWADALQGREAGKRAASREPCRDLYAFRWAATGASGIDVAAGWDTLDVGFSPAVLGMGVAQRPGVELLAIVGLETLPLVSFGWHECGFIHGGRTFRFAVEERAGKNRRWGTLHDVARPE